MASATIQRFPASAPPAYQTARAELLKAEIALREQTEAVAAQRRSLPTGAKMEPYSFTDAATDKAATLSSLVGDGRTLVVYHMMFTAGQASPCPMCASWVDGMNGIAAHAAQRVNVVVIAAAPAQQIRKYADMRGWTGLRFLSSAGTTFNRDMGVEVLDDKEKASADAEWVQMPGVSVFVQDKDDASAVRHVYTQSALMADGVYGGLDTLSPLWNLLDLVPEGRGKEWMPTNDYIEKRGA